MEQGKHKEVPFLSLSTDVLVQRTRNQLRCN